MQVALFQPDIPQNTGTILRLCACLDVAAHIIEPAGFPTSDKAFRRAGMDYLDQVRLQRHDSWSKFEQWRQGLGHRLLLFTTKGADSYLDYAYKPADILLFGRESIGVPTKSSRPPMRGWSFPSSRACARSMWRWQPPWRSARRCGRRDHFQGPVRENW
jgi:tRNA (cytidine/uridine-2'-O-)-methyltransferase